jgi:hypothetical protein
MDVFGCGGVGLRSRQNPKRKRFTEGPDECVPAKRPLTEETMAAFMHQLNLSTSVSHGSAPSPLSVAGPLNITAVTTCPSTNVCCPDELRTRGVSSSQVSPSHEESPPPHHVRVLTPPASFDPSTRPDRQQLLGSPLTEGLDLATPSQHPVHISVTPATPPSSESSGSLSQEDSEPMEQSSLLPRRVGQRRSVVQEDPSSDSSDNEMSPRVWLAPELKSLASSRSRLLPPPVLNEIAKVELAVVPWVSREQCLARVLAKSWVRRTMSFVNLEGAEDYRSKTL